MKMKKIFATVTALVVTAAAVPAFAEGSSNSIQGIDTTSLVAMMTTLGGMVGAIGMAALSVVMGIKAVGYIKSALGK